MDADFGLTVENADKARHRHQLHLQPRIALKQAAQTGCNEHDADAFGDPQTDLAQRRHGLGDFFLCQQRNVFHRLGVLEQRLPGRGQFVPLRMLHEQRCAQMVFDGLNVPRHRAVGGIEAFGGGQQAAAALQLQKIPQVIPVEHECPRAQL